MGEHLQHKLSEVLQNPNKTLADATFIYERIRTLHFFNTFFSQNLRNMDVSDILLLCRTFEYEEYEAGELVFEKGDPSNNKFYVIISGTVAILKPYTKEEKVKMKESNVKTNRFIEKKNLKVPKRHLDSKVSLDVNPGSTVKTLLWQMSIVAEENQKPQREQHIVEQTSPLKKSYTSPVFKKIRGDTLFKELANNYDDFISDYGHLIGLKLEGESFGDLALKHDKPRAASIFCKTDCEFLTITKQQFDLIFLKKEQDKENFLKEVFPFIPSLIASSLNFNNLFCSFQTEVYSKGTYLTNEGKIANKEPKFFIIYQGECLLEKNLAIEQSGSVDRMKSINYSNQQPIRIAIIGRKAIVGEEILITGNEYNYSVKAISDAVIAHTITKEGFDSLYFQKEFYSFLMEIYNRKKNQRLIILENAQKERQRKERKHKVDLIREKRLKQDNLMSSINQNVGSFSYRESPANNTFDSPKVKIPVLQRTLSHQFGIPSSSRSNLRIPTGEDEVIPPMIQIPRGTKGMLKVTDILSCKNQGITSKLEFLSTASKPSEVKVRSDEEDNFESLRLFKPEDVKRSFKLDESRKPRRIKQSQPSQGSTSPSSKQKRETIDYSELILRDVAKVAQKFQTPTLQMVEMKDKLRSKERELSSEENLTSLILKQKSLSKHHHVLSPRFLETPKADVESPQFSSNLINARHLSNQDKPFIPLLRINNIDENEVRNLGYLTSARNRIRVGKETEKPLSMVRKISRERSRKHKPTGSMKLKAVERRDTSESLSLYSYSLIPAIRDSSTLRSPAFQFQNYAEKESLISNKRSSANDHLKITAI